MHFISDQLENYSKHLLPLYTSRNPRLSEKDNEFQESMLELANQGQIAFERSTLPSHFTASALLFSPDGKKIALTHHKKLNKWIQLGGHADGDQNLFEVARKEAQEESGIQMLQSIRVADSIIPFDIDIHEIPQDKQIGPHFHFDVRYLFRAQSIDLVISEESNDLRWFELGQVSQVSDEWSLLKQIEKVYALAANGFIELGSH